VTIENTGSRPLHGHVQIPKINLYLGIGYPPRQPTLSRQALDLEPGERRRYHYKRGVRHATDRHGGRVHVAFVRPDGDWHLAIVSGWTKRRSIRLEAALDSEGNSAVRSDGPWEIAERVLDLHAMLEIMGDWKRR